jgi:lysophospholipase L1-like esterase
MMVLPLGCGDQGPEEENLPDCETAEITDSPGVRGRIYLDADSTDSSRYDQNWDEETDTPVAARSLTLRGPGGTETTGSCADGTYAFNDLADGVYLVEADSKDEDCLQKNCPQHVGAAVDRGDLVILTWGDSVPAYGGAPYFPKRLKNMLSDLVDVDSRNVAEPGSESTDWLPGATYYEQHLVPNIADADLVVMSIGGNDLVAELSGVDLSDIDGAVEQAYELMAGILENVRTTVEALREINPDADYVYCLYVDYSLSTIGGWGLADLFLPEGTVSQLISDARDLVGVDDPVLLSDLYGASHTLALPLDNYMVDELHFNSAGHTFYAEEIFKTLGGVLVGESPLGGDPRTPLGDEHNFSFAP